VDIPRSEIRKGNAAVRNLISEYNRHEKLEVFNQRATIWLWAEDCHIIGGWGDRDGGAAIQVRST
jgi:hypothetical protein